MRFSANDKYYEFSIREAAEILGIDYERLRQWIRDGCFPSIAIPEARKKIWVSEYDFYRIKIFDILIRHVKSPQGIMDKLSESLSDRDLMSKDSICVSLEMNSREMFNNPGVSVVSVQPTLQIVLNLDLVREEVGALLDAVL